MYLFSRQDNSVRARRNKNNSELVQENGESMDDSVAVESKPKASALQQVSSDQESGSNGAQTNSGDGANEVFKEADRKGTCRVQRTSPLHCAP